MPLRWIVVNWSKRNQIFKSKQFWAERFNHVVDTSFKWKQSRVLVFQAHQWQVVIEVTSLPSLRRSKFLIVIPILSQSTFQGRSWGVVVYQYTRREKPIIHKMSLQIHAKYQNLSKPITWGELKVKVSRGSLEYWIQGDFKGAGSRYFR